MDKVMDIDEITDLPKSAKQIWLKNFYSNIAIISKSSAFMLVFYGETF